MPDSALARENHCITISHSSYCVIISINGSKPRMEQSGDPSCAKLDHTTHSGSLTDRSRSTGPFHVPCVWRSSVSPLRRRRADRPHGRKRSLVPTRYCLRHRLRSHPMGSIRFGRRRINRSTSFDALRAMGNRNILPAACSLLPFVNTRLPRQFDVVLVEHFRSVPDLGRGLPDRSLELLDNPLN